MGLKIDLSDPKTRGLIEDLAAHLFWTRAAHTSFLRSKGTPQDEAAKFFDFTTFNNIYENQGFRNKEPEHMRVIYSVVLDRIKANLKEDSNLNGMLFLEELLDFRGQNERVSNVLNLLKENRDGENAFNVTCKGRTAQSLVAGKLVLRTPLPAVILLQDVQIESFDQLIICSDTSVLGFKKILLLMVQDITALPPVDGNPYKYCASGVFQLCARDKAALWPKILPNFCDFEDEFICHGKNFEFDIKVNKTEIFNPNAIIPAGEARVS